MPLSQKPSSAFSSAPIAVSSAPSTVSSQAMTDSAPSWTNSKTWTSYQVQVQDEYRVMQRHIKKESLEKSPFLPTSFQSYLVHRAAILDDHIREQKCAIAAKKETLRARRGEASSAKVTPALMGKDFEGIVMCSLGKYRWEKEKWWPLPDGWKEANRQMDEDGRFRAEGELLVGGDLVKRL